MVNSVEEVDKFLSKGCNALEVDIEFADNGAVLGTYHGVPCDCFRSCSNRVPIADYLKHVRNVTAWRDSPYRGQMSLLFLDLKTAKLSKYAKLTAGETLAQNIITHLWKGVNPKYRMNVLLSIGYVKDSDVTRGALKIMQKKGPADFLSNIGFDVGMNDPLKNIAHMYETLRIKGHRWQGDGLSNCLRFLMPVERLKAAVELRDSEDGYVDKVYHWTIDMPFYITDSIRLGVDGIITNNPSEVLRVVTSNLFRDSLRVADMGDSPWLKIRRSALQIKQDAVRSATSIVARGTKGE
ncbi:dermonecrotic toxin SPH-like [Dermacentor andersoni]|uniref:dermonecrotic toxin SPH-like n=1 Tax=Dermacentor andersoni TaxID=34620 RepID=UPI0021555661|nr:dermonecrotic toxin SPH-like [Dermacentor andersoni]